VGLAERAVGSDELAGPDDEAAALDAGQYVAGEMSPNRIGLYENQGPLNAHGAGL